MSPPGARSRPDGESRAAVVVRHGGRVDGWTVPQAIRDRRDAALRLAPWTALWGLPGRDPLCPERETSPSSFGLRRHELEAEVARCRDAGWSSDELRERFVSPQTAPA